MSDRGQTSVDLLAAVGVFIVAFGFVVGFIPGLLSPFEGDVAAPLVADRTATTLGDDLLAGTAPGDLDPACTAAFFGASSASDAGCPFDRSASLTERVGIDRDHHLHVRLVRKGAVVCGDSSGMTPCADGGTRLATDEVPPPSGAVTTARRAVSVDDRDAVLEVTVW
jgi:hypothetical protein